MNPEDTFFLYRVSYYYYTLLGALITVGVGLVVSFLTGPQDPRTVSRALLSPAIHGFLPGPRPPLKPTLPEGRELHKLARC